MNDKKCDEKCKYPGLFTVAVIGLVMYAVTLILFFSNALADVRVEIIRDTPEERQTIIQQFADTDEFAMWMQMKMEDGCDPYVTKLKIDLDYVPNTSSNTNNTPYYGLKPYGVN